MTKGQKFKNKNNFESKAKVEIESKTTKSRAVWLAERLL
jgi:hypothetical protein